MAASGCGSDEEEADTPAYTVPPETAASARLEDMNAVYDEVEQRGNEVFVRLSDWPGAKVREIRACL